MGTLWGLRMDEEVDQQPVEGLRRTTQYNGRCLCSARRTTYLCIPRLSIISIRQPA